jgi:DNA-directed RNA polymerase subunit RPC12/RpoP
MAKCTKCQAEVDDLAVFPGGLCLTCWTPIGNIEARTMTADKLARMWGGK